MGEHVIGEHLDATLDHVAVAVPDIAAAATDRWRDELGGAWMSRADNPTFLSAQLRYPGGGRLELLAPPEDANQDNFVRRFLQRFGAAIHHVTLKVPDLPVALDALEAAGLDVVDVDQTDDWWHEGFLRPSQVGGLVVQVAWSAGSEEQWAERIGFEAEPVITNGARLLGPLLRHPDLTAAARLWELLGAGVTRPGEELVCAWPDSPLRVWVTEGAPPGPVALRFAGAAPLPAADGVGPPVEAVDPEPAH